MDISPHARRPRLTLARIALTASLVGFAALARAEAPAPEGGTPAGADTASQERDKAQRELDAVREEQRQAADAEAKLHAETEAISEDRSKLNQALIDTAGRIRALETRIAASEERITTLDDKGRAIRQSLSERRTVIAEVLAALQRVGRRPPPALMVRP